MTSGKKNTLKKGKGYKKQSKQSQTYKKQSTYKEIYSKYYGHKENDFTTHKVNDNISFTPDFELLKRILLVQSESYNSIDMELFLIGYFKEKGFEVSDDTYGNFYVTKHENKDSNLFVGIVSHTDTVHDIIDNYNVFETDDLFFGFDEATGEQYGCGGDDKVGIFAALTMFDKFDNIKLFFAKDEEVGTIGSYHCNIEFFEDCTLLIQCDRAGNDEVITFTNGVKVASTKFEKSIRPLLSKYNYHLGHGSITDVGTLVKQNIGITAINIGCGYWNAHRSKEVVVKADVTNCFNLVYDILKLYENEISHHKIQLLKEGRRVGFIANSNSNTNTSYNATNAVSDYGHAVCSTCWEFVDNCICDDK